MAISVSVACSEAGKQVWLKLEVAEGSTVLDTVNRANLAKTLPGFTLEGHSFGIFGKLVKPETLVKTGDRVEIYRPITCDPETIPRRNSTSE